jgi:glycosyltransferase involved in cell wall biosynthesis
LILLTSIGEGTPNVLLEAQWLGLPVVTTDAGGAGEAVLDGVTGILVKTGEADAIADAVVGVLRDKTFRETVRREGPSFIAATYGMERMIDELLSLYRSNGATKHGPPRV